MTRTWFADERHAQILRLLATEGRVESSRLATSFDISAESVRKDLALLDGRGLLRRVHGGAIPREASRAESHVADRDEHVAEKTAIARLALRHVPHGASLLLDAGSTTLRLAEMLPADGELVVYTNSWPVGAALHDRGITVQTLGGRIRPATMAAVGTLTAQALASINVDVAFLGTNGLSLDRGLTTPDAEEADVKRRMLAAAKQRIFLVDSSKFGCTSLARHAELSDVDVLITDAGITAPQRKRLRAAGIAVEVAGR
ncbi:DeoR family transcriptional regulator [Mycobacterium antarcticum]|uniref:DeoR/GlpR family DNA-binding transcription regulator n=1 Tax=unclassified Mycolicibacterium TaxID=2636767 RepID=UPI00238CF458|nr:MULTISPECIES: DeoR/GlpR family DNA-binding transcription regulator [unclassified Mycolicibacterium]BDX34193.1 DeoR family transcriptional regulator [Mycolicibacterium sp. TUM20985]GLP77395.1 DeoR family transcriptional regulator [Mycolicibacterium sp. TUM20983]GLP82201.1 DeoR family transcriptional regulator [Mycolicibacterium sp. TUM20984]